MEAGVKYDAGKSRMDLVDGEWMLGVGRVLGVGAEKYSDYNWRSLSPSRIYAAAMRHLLQSRKNTPDDETGESHLLHASCCLMMLYWHEMEGRDFE